ncbi:MAG TPA: DUF4384 domain-containing protein [Gemmatimonadales bacterium]|nr:DUF4384 domain-containing protein [Gemmatimonadales bacterium]
MLVTPLVRLLLAGLPLVTPGPAPDLVPFPPPGAARRVAVWTGHDAPYRHGETARVYLRVDEASYVAVFRVDTDGRLRVLFPREPWGDSYLREQRELELTGRRGGDGFRVDDDPGVGYVFALAADRPFDFGAITRGDAWDYRLIDGGRIQGDPYVALTELAARLSPAGGYDYDIAPYYVGRHYDYPRFVCYDCHAYAGFDEWNPYDAACTRYRVVVRDAPRYYPYRYGGTDVVADRPAHPGPRFTFRDTGRRDPADLGRGRGAVPRPRPPSARQDSARTPPERRQAPERVRPAADAPRSTGEPELRRRRP